MLVSGITRTGTGHCLAFLLLQLLRNCCLYIHYYTEKAPTSLALVLIPNFHIGTEAFIVFNLIWTFHLIKLLYYALGMVRYNDFMSNTDTETYLLIPISIHYLFNVQSRNYNQCQTHTDPKYRNKPYVYPFMR